MLNKERFIKMLECDRETAVSTITACFLLMPGISQEYEETVDRNTFYKETMNYFIEKTNSELLEEAIYLGIIE